MAHGEVDKPRWCEACHRIVTAAEQHEGGHTWLSCSACGWLLDPLETAEATIEQAEAWERQGAQASQVHGAQTAIRTIKSGADWQEIMSRLPAVVQEAEEREQREQKRSLEHMSKNELLNWRDALHQSMWHKQDDPKKVVEIAAVESRLHELAVEERQKRAEVLESLQRSEEREHQQEKADFLEFSLGKQLWMLYQAVREGGIGHE